MRFESLRLSEIFEKLENEEMLLPNFQRGFVWNADKQKKLLCSFIVKIPIGSTLHLEGKKNEFAARALCEKNQLNFNREDNSSCEYILDGQQRLSTLKNAFFNLFENQENWRETLNSLFENLRIRWFLKIDNDYFGYEKLKFDRSFLEKVEPKVLEDFLVYKKITSTKDTDKWFHPNFEKSSNESTKIIRRKACEEKLVPLYEIYKKENGLHRKILECIALDRIQDIKHDIDEGKLNIQDFIDIEENESEENIRQKLIIYANNWVNAVSNYLESLLDSEIPYIRLPNKEMGRAAAIFEEINKGGLALSTYDLIVAKTAKYSDVQLTQKIIESFNEDFNLNQLLNISDWNPSCMLTGKEGELSKKLQDIFLNSLSVIIYGKVRIEKLKEKVRKLESNLNEEVDLEEKREIEEEIKKVKDEINNIIEKEHLYQNSILSLNGEDIVNNLDRIIQAIKRTYAFLQFRCGIIKESNIRYNYMILPIVYLLDEDTIWNDRNKLDVLEAWYWSSFFSGEFRENQDEKFIKNLRKLKKILIDEERVNDWINEEDNIISFGMYEKILYAQDYSDFDTLIKEPPKAMEDAILQYCLSREPLDFYPESSIKLTAYKAACNPDDLMEEKRCKKYKLEIHHIIPLASARKIGETSKELRRERNHILNSPLNLVYISECANREIRDLDVDTYLSQLGNRITDNCLNTEENFYKRRENEQEEDYYKRVLKNRYEKIKDALKTEIRDLVRSYNI